MRKPALLCLIVVLFIGWNTDNIFAGEMDDFRFAVGLYSDRNFSLAESELQDFLRKYPNSPFLDNAKFLLGNIYLQRNEHAKALTVFDELYKTGTDPHIRAEVLLGLAQSSFFVENRRQAHTYFSGFLRDFKHHGLLWKAHYYLGRLEYLSENYEKSLHHLEEAKKLHPDLMVAVAHLNTLLKLSRFDEAEKSIQGYIDTEIKDEQIYRMIVIYLNTQLNRREYRTVLSFARDYIPADSQYYDDYLVVLGEAKIEQEQYKEGLELLAKMRSKTERSEYLTALSFLRTNQDARAASLFTELSNNADNVEIRSNSFFFLASIRGKTDIAETNRMLNQFVRQHPEHPFTGAAYYQLGLNHFTLDQYGDAVNYFTKALSEKLDSELKEKAIYLRGESYFQLQYSTQAINDFNNYLDAYPKGSFVDEVLFKSGLHYFRQQDHPNAFVRFNRLITEYPESNRTAMANFYQGEIFTSRNQYDLAFEKYQKALADFQDRGLIRLRMAQINFNLGKYDETLKHLDNVPDTKTFIYEKSTLKGNTLFAKGNYLEALRSFEAALNSAETDTAREDALVRQARTLYQMKEYRESLAIYRRLIEQNPQEQYVLMAAAVAFTANNYTASIQLYKRFLDDYPESRDYYRAQLHLADSYYNLGDYSKAASEYQKLIKPGMERAILINSLNGVQWSASQSEEVDFELFINNAIKPDSPTDFILLLNSRLVNHFFDSRRWDDVISLSRTIIEIAPPEYDTRHIRLRLAKSLTYTELYDKAEDVYRELHRQKAEANVLFSWAELHILQQDSLAAINRVRQASKLTRESTVWLQMLRLGVQLKDRDFLKDYENYLAFAQNVEREQAQLLWIKWQLQEGNLDTALPRIETLLESQYEPIKAKAQYFKGVHLYKSGRVSEAIRELLRVRYLYPRIEDVRLDAELLACYAYLETGRRDEALRLFDTIKGSLPQAEREKLSNKLGLEGQ